MKLFAVSDLHLGHAANREALGALPPQPDDWLILAGDLGERLTHLVFALEMLTPRFKQLIWVPGNHDLWTIPGRGAQLRGEEKYRRLVDVCRTYGVLTAEDPYPIWRGQGPRCRLVPLFLLYDYTFRPDGVAPEEAVAWAAETGIRCADESYLHPDPHGTRADWCRQRCRYSEERLAALSGEDPVVLINHFPLRRDLAYTPRIPRFSPWCGTRRTEDWHRRYNALAVVSGHLHIRTTRWRDGVRFEEVSLGYPHQWKRRRGLQAYLREILPGDGRF